MSEPDRATGFAVLPAFIARDGSIEPPLKVLLLALSSFSGADESSWPSNRTLQDCTGMSERSVRDWIRKGESAGLLVVSRRFDTNGAPLSNKYRLNFARWGIRDPKDQRQDLPGVPADSAGGWGDGLPQEGREAAPGWGDGLPPNKTSEQDQENMTSGSLTLTSPSAPATESKPKKPSKPKAAPKPFTPPTHDEVAQRLRDKGLDKPTASFEATAFIEYWDASDWKGVTNWRKNLATWLTNWRRRNPVQQPRDFTSRWTVQPGQDPDPWGGCRE